MKTEARQSFSHGFVLTEQELRRIADVATQQLGKVRPSPPPKTEIELRFRNGTITESDSLDDLFSLENVGAKHIVRMRISFESEKDNPPASSQFRTTSYRSHSRIPRKTRTNARSRTQ